MKKLLFLILVIFLGFQAISFAGDLIKTAQQSMSHAQQKQFNNIMHRNE